MVFFLFPRWCHLITSKLLRIQNNPSFGLRKHLLTFGSIYSTRAHTLMFKRLQQRFTVRIKRCFYQLSEHDSANQKNTILFMLARSMLAHSKCLISNLAEREPKKPSRTASSPAKRAKLGQKSHTALANIKEHCPRCHQGQGNYSGQRKPAENNLGFSITTSTCFLYA